MITIILQVLGWLIFIAGTITLGAWLRRHPGKRNAERTSRITHLLFWMLIIPATGIGVIHPGLTHYDAELGLQPLRRGALLLTVGALIALIGAYLMIASNIALRWFGKGAHAFRLTKRVVVKSIYQRTRNPMSLGLYLWSVGVGLLVGSTYLTLGALLAVIPAHIFYLKYFEEYELALRMGQAYLEYKQRVPFLFPKATS